MSVMQFIRSLGLKPSRSIKLQNAPIAVILHDVMLYPWLNRSCIHEYLPIPSIRIASCIVATTYGNLLLSLYSGNLSVPITYIFGL